MPKIREMSEGSLVFDTGISISRSGNGYKVETETVDKCFKNFVSAWTYVQKAPFKNFEEASRAYHDTLDNGVVEGEGKFISHIAKRDGFTLSSDCLVLKNGAEMSKLLTQCSHGPFRYTVWFSRKSYKERDRWTEPTLRFFSWQAAWAYALRGPFRNYQEAFEVYREVSLPYIDDIVAWFNRGTRSEKNRITYEMVKNAYDYSVQDHRAVFFSDPYELILRCPENRRKFQEPLQFE